MLIHSETTPPLTPDVKVRVRWYVLPREGERITVLAASSLVPITTRGVECFAYNDELEFELPVSVECSADGIRAHVVDNIHDHVLEMCADAVVALDPSFKFEFDDDDEEPAYYYY